MPRAASIGAFLLLVLYLAQCAWFIRTQSFTYDEPEHIVAGLEAWRYGEFKQWHDQPPLARLLFTLPLAKSQWSYRYTGVQVRPVSPVPEQWLWPARAVVSLMGALFLLLLWRTARRFYSEAAALFVLALAALSPELIAHFSLATIDGLGALLTFAAALAWLRYWKSNTRRDALLLGIVLGLLLLAKFNSPPQFVLTLGLVLVLAPGELRKNPLGLQFRRMFAVLGLACLVVWAGYFFHVSRVTFANQAVTLHFPGYTKSLLFEMPTGKTPVTIFMPACEWFTGLGMVIAHNMEGHRGFFLGNCSTQGWRMYFPVAMLLKWPVLVLLTGTAGLLLAVARQTGRWRDLLVLAVFPAVYLALAMTSHINIGVRHVLPLYPFLLLFCGACADSLLRVGKSPRGAYIALAAIVLLQAADVARYAPSYLSYFDAFVPQNETWRLLSTSNTDWGQPLVALRAFQQQHSGRTLHLAYVGEVDPAFYGIRYVPLREDDHPSGLVAVSATHLSGELLHDPEAYLWLLRYPRVAVLDHAMYVFDVPEGAAVPPPAPHSASPALALRHSLATESAAGKAALSPEQYAIAPLCTPQAPLCHIADHEADHGDGWRVVYAWP
ncbi:MAG: glycosyltransferase family 39 protein [Acidobacteriota bacterium]|nr:glycosyltransferase family 39 protein [Acidobacteriota bacterium]